MDEAGHVHHTAYLRYLEDTRIAVFRDAGFDSPSVVAQMDIDYLTPLRYGHAPARIETSVTRIGRSSFQLRHDVWSDRIHAAADCTVVAFDPASQTGRALTDSERQGLERFRIS